VIALDSEVSARPRGRFETGVTCSETRGHMKKLMIHAPVGGVELASQVVSK
jgi:hypothetical protein